jgi:hypothetical protein
MPAVNGVGEPCAGEPHARFEVAGVGNGMWPRQPGHERRRETCRESGRTYSNHMKPRQPPTLHEGPERTG